MAVIALAGNTIGCCIGTGSFECVGTAFSSAKQTVKLLTQGISTLKSKIDTARLAANVDTSHTQAQNAEKREETKQGALTTGYDKLETLISDINIIDNKSASKIQTLKNDFYAQYSYLKPECEKSTKEKIKDKWEGVKSWCKEHWVEILVGVTLIVIGALITVFTAGTGTGFWAAFGAAFLGGLKTAIITGLVSGGINVACNIGVTLLKGEKLNFSNIMDAFGDGLASGFMFGGIMAGVSMTVSSVFRIAASNGVPTGPAKNFKLGRRTYPDNLNPQGGGTIWNFAKSKKAPGFRFDVDIRTLKDGFLPNYFHLHLPFVGKNTILPLGIILGHIPFGLYTSIVGSSVFSNSDTYSDFKKWQRESWRKLFGN